MSVLSINSGYIGSTGTIMMNISRAAQRAGYQAFISCPDNRSRPIRKNYKEPVPIRVASGVINNKILFELSRWTGYEGQINLFHTLSLCHFMSKRQIDLVHLHNLHISFLHYPAFFHYICKKSIPVVWTLHDCWALTGRCPHFQLTKCDRWKTGCHDCPYPKQAYPASFVDRSAEMWRLKKHWFTSVKNMTIVTPSQWLADLVKQSYLKDYPIQVIHNGIDLSIFRPTPGDFREKHGISQERKLLLGVADGWGEKKGLDVFVELSRRLDKNYQIVLVGTNDATDKLLPESIISVHRTQNQRELAEIYSAADVFVNPTREDTFPTVNLEALACGTPVITFDTGGSPECIDETCGLVVPCDNIDALEAAIRRVCAEQLFTSEACIRRAGLFDQNDRYQEYVELYERLEPK